MYACSAPLTHISATRPLAAELVLRRILVTSFQADHPSRSDKHKTFKLPSSAALVVLSVTCFLSGSERRSVKSSGSCSISGHFVGAAFALMSEAPLEEIPGYAVRHASILNLFD